MTLQERLREPKAWMAWNDYGTLTIAGDPIPAMDHDSQAPREAADALDAQEARIKALEGALREYACACGEQECAAGHPLEQRRRDCINFVARALLGEK